MQQRLLRSRIAQEVETSWVVERQEGGHGVGERFSHPRHPGPVCVARAAKVRRPFLWEQLKGLFLLSRARLMVTSGLLGLNLHQRAKAEWLIIFFGLFYGYYFWHASHIAH